MEHLETKTGFLFTTLTTGIIFQDVLMAFVLGIVGAGGGYFFKVVKDYFVERLSK